MTTSARSWLAELAHALQLSPPTDAEMDDLLALASVAAHASERAAAPVACWMAARAGQTPAAALELARELVEQADHPVSPGASGDDAPRLAGGS